jgi:hypothetical protein
LFSMQRTNATVSCKAPVSLCFALFGERTPILLTRQAAAGESGDLTSSV